MKLYNYIEKNNITQIYKPNNITNKYFDFLKEYLSLIENTIFTCYDDFDIKLINLHKGKKWIFIDENFNIKYTEKLNLKTIECFLCDSEKLKKNYTKLNLKCTNVNSKLSNHNKIIKVNTIKNILYLILATDKELYSERYNKLLAYLKNFKEDYLILLGNHNKIEKKNNILYVDIEDHYENIPKKIITALEWIYKNTWYTHIYKVDDDFFKVNINTDNELLNLDYYGNYIINNMNRKYHFNKCHDQELNTIEYENKFFYKYAAGGYGYILSRKSIYILLQNKSYIFNEIYEDKAIGDVLYKNNIIVNNTNYKHINYKINKYIIKKYNTTKNCAVIFFHKNLRKLYKSRWIEKCIDSILEQTYDKYDILEINYGNDEYSILTSKQFNNKHYFYKRDYSTHTEAMMFLLNKAFCEMNYDIVFNTNLDDFYHIDRFEKQLECIDYGYELCTSLMNYTTENEETNEDYTTKVWTAETYGMTCDSKYIDTDQIKFQLNNNHNVMNHPCICYTKEFWSSFDKNNNLLRYRDDKPYEDLSLWTRAINNNIKITIINEPLIEYRLHANQIGEQNKKKTKDNNVDKGFKKEPSKEKKRIGIFCVGTGKYIYYLEQLLQSIEEFFLKQYKKTYFISTDQIKYAEKICKKYKVKHHISFIHKKGFPLDTLYRYKYLLKHGIKVELLCDVLYYLDMDMRIVDVVGEEILPDKNKVLVGTKHPGFAYSGDKNGSPETNPISTAYIDRTEFKECYIAGGFNGGITHYFLELARDIQYKINIDKSKDIIAVWHDESQLNRYFISNYNKFKILSPDYCYPENFYKPIPGDPKILALDKDHHQIRNVTQKNYLIVNVVGGFGNLLFQIFFGYAIALRYNLELVVAVDSKEQKRKSIYHYHIFDNITRIKYEENDDDYIVKETTKNYSNLLKNIPMNKNIYLTGYFQSTLYFIDYFKRIKKQLNLKVLDIATEIINNIKKEYKNKKIVSLHIRGDDYIEFKNYHHNLSNEYYDKCFNKINEKNKIVILFTDDISYANKKFKSYYDLSVKDLINKYLPKEYEYLKICAELEMFLMSLCDIIICANSTFSLWASYFSNSDEIYIPKKWFGIDGPKEFTTDEFKLNSNYIII